MMKTESATETYPQGLPRHTNDEWRELNDRVLTPNFGRRRLALVRGRGSRVWDADGREFIDFLTGISVNNLGHCHPRITRAIQEQAETLVHCSNLYYIPMQIELARLLTDRCFAERVFFGNSGAEANEAAIKIARRWAHDQRGPDVKHIITMRNSFHGRTLATLSASGQEKLWQKFDPLVEGFHHAEQNDLKSVEALIDDKTCAIMLEPIQGEGGFLPASQEFISGVRELCDRHKLLLIFDEIQTAFCRTGKIFAYEHYGVEPDVMTLAKSLGGGLAMGAMLTRADIAEAFPPGAHGSTMGGNVLTCAAAIAYVSELIDGDYCRQSREKGAYLKQRLEEGLVGCPIVKEVRGIGLMVGVEVSEQGAEIVQACEERGLLVNFTAGTTIRTHPPLNIERAEIDAALEILIPAIREAAVQDA